MKKKMNKEDLLPTQDNSKDNLLDFRYKLSLPKYPYNTMQQLFFNQAFLVVLSANKEKEENVLSEEIKKMNFLDDLSKKMGADKSVMGESLKKQSNIISYEKRILQELVSAIKVTNVCIHRCERYVKKMNGVMQKKDINPFSQCSFYEYLKGTCNNTQRLP